MSLIIYFIVGCLGAMILARLFRSERTWLARSVSTGAPRRRLHPLRLGSRPLAAEDCRLLFQTDSPLCTAIIPQLPFADGQTKSSLRRSKSAPLNLKNAGAL
ncbi:unnamed protein product [Peniophora sp. CBMAI 1063]|nr:unnamed protein product [Peniophora sp. CBMAI 1063]